jgi:hypothetical protein
MSASGGGLMSYGTGIAAMAWPVAAPAAGGTCDRVTYAGRILRGPGAF